MSWFGNWLVAQRNFQLPILPTPTPPHQRTGLDSISKRLAIPATDLPWFRQWAHLAWSALLPTGPTGKWGLVTSIWTLSGLVIRGDSDQISLCPATRMCGVFNCRVLLCSLQWATGSSSNGLHCFRDPTGPSWPTAHREVDHRWRNRRLLGVSVFTVVLRGLSLSPHWAAPQCCAQSAVTTHVLQAEPTRLPSVCSLSCSESMDTADKTCAPQLFTK